MNLTQAVLLGLLHCLWASAYALDCTQISAPAGRASVCRVDLSADQIALYLTADNGKPFNSFAALERQLKARNKTLLFAMNAGMYHADYSPVGLFIANGKQLTPLNAGHGNGNFYLKPNGVFLIANGRAAVLPADDYDKQRPPAVLATQSGPLLLQDGKVHPAFKPASTSRLIRNGVCAESPFKAIFAISDDPMNLYEFSLLFRDAIGCKDALYLDGTVSSLYSPQLNRRDAYSKLGPMIAVIESPAD